LWDNISLKGFLVSIYIISRSSNKAIITFNIYKANLGSSMSKYYLTYVDNSLNFEDPGVVAVS
jgi:hypothetical protein